jgi:hypothetical protein
MSDKRVKVDTNNILVCIDELNESLTNLRELERCFPNSDFYVSSLFRTAEKNVRDVKTFLGQLLEGLETAPNKAKTPNEISIKITLDQESFKDTMNNLKSLELICDKLKKIPLFS